MSARRACRWLGLGRSWLCYVGGGKDDGELAAKLKELAAANPRYGVRRLCVMLRREGRSVNHKRVRRLCRENGLMLKQKRKRKRRGIGVGVPCRAEHPGHVWAYDLVEDRTEMGRKVRILTVVDEFTRECMTVEVEYRMNARFVAETLVRLFGERGAPKYVRSDNGPEFIAKHLMRTLAGRGVQARHIDPGSPWQNGRNERFNGSLRDECLNLETFHNRDHARALVKLYGRQFNERRPHSALDYLTPKEFAEKWKEPAGTVPAAQVRERSL
jgi:putative transposase